MCHSIEKQILLFFSLISRGRGRYDVDIGRQVVYHFWDGRLLVAKGEDDGRQAVDDAYEEEGHADELEGFEPGFGRMYAGQLGQ
jgi:hypothetical protein